MFDKTNKGYTWWMRNRGKIKWLLVVNFFIWFWPLYYGKNIYQDILTPQVITIAQTEKVVYEQMPDTVKSTLEYYADLYGVDKGLVFSIVECESRFDPNRNGDFQEALLSHGLWQFQPPTFFEFAKKYKVKNADINDWRDQTIVAVQMLRDGECHNWTCCPKGR